MGDSNSGGGSSKKGASSSNRSWLENQGYTKDKGYYVHKNNSGGYSATYLGTPSNTPSASGNYKAGGNKTNTGNYNSSYLTSPVGIGGAALNAVSSMLPGGSLIGNAASTLYNYASSGLGGGFTGGGTGYSQTAPLVEQPPAYEIQYPEYPTYSGMSREEALRQASGQIDPLAELAQMNLNDTYAQQRARLPQYLNARGQLYGGLRAGGESEITNEQAMALDKSRLGFNAQKEEVANALQTQDEARARELADRQYQSELNNANLAMSKWQTDMTNYTRSQEDQNKNAQWLKNYELQLAAANRLANQDAYNQEQDQFSNDLALAGLTGMYGGQPTMDYQRMQYDINKPYYSPNTGGSSPTAYQQYQMQRNTTQDAAASDQKLRDMALEMAKADPRLGIPDANAANTLSQLVDAYYQQLKSQSGGGYSDSDLMQYLR